MRYAAKRDVNEQAIVDALEAIGVQVLRVSQPGVPDLLTWRADKGFQLLEIKQRWGQMTFQQKQFSMPFRVVRTVEQALAAFGIDT